MAGYSIVISATDAASGAINRVNERIVALNKRVALAAAPFNRLQASLEKLAKVSGLGAIAAGFGDIAHQSGAAVRSLFRVIEPLAAITGAASLAGMYKLVTAWGDFSAALGIQSQRAGVLGQLALRAAERGEAGQTSAPTP